MSFCWALPGCVGFSWRTELLSNPPHINVAGQYGWSSCFTAREHFKLIYGVCNAAFAESALPFFNFLFGLYFFAVVDYYYYIFFSALLAWSKPWCAPAVCGQGRAPLYALLAQSFMCWFLRSAIIYCIRFMFLPEHK